MQSVLHAGGQSETDGDTFPDNKRARLAELEAMGLDDRLASGQEFMDRLILQGDLHTEPDVPDAPPEFVLLPSRTATTVTIVFSGNQARFLLPDELIAHVDTHLILVRDRRRCFCLAGISGLGSDYATCISNLEAIIAALGATGRYVIGVSAGGSGAMKFGCDLKADGMLGFSIPTTLNLADDPGAEMQRYPQLRKLYSLDRALGIDLAAYYQAASPRPSLTLIYSAEHTRDCWLAGRMRGMDGVELLETEGFSGHATFRWLRQQGRIAHLLSLLYTFQKVHTGVPPSARVSTSMLLAATTTPQLVEALPAA